MMLARFRQGVSYGCETPFDVLLTMSPAIGGSNGLDSAFEQQL